MTGVVRAASLIAIACVVVAVLLGVPSVGVGHDRDAVHAMAGDRLVDPDVRGVAHAPATDATVSITASADTYVRSGAPNTNGGASTITAKVDGSSFTADVNDDPLADVLLDNLGSTIRLEGWNGVGGNPTAFLESQNTFPADGVDNVLFSGAITGFPGDAVPTDGPVPGA